MPKPLVIVESPAKARTISRFLGAGYLVESSIGHIRDLPRNASEVPAAFKTEAWARTGVDVDNDFKPLYVVSKDKKGQVKKLKDLLADASELYLATDEDREGESIAWHLLEVLSPKVPVRRMVFHEITKSAIQHAIESPRELDRRLVDAQEARRILDRLYGYEISPVLWRKVQQGLSAGRVQSVACRILVQRERERISFRSATYFDVAAVFAKGVSEFTSKLTSIGERRVATGRDFDSTGALSSRSSGSKTIVVDETLATSLVDGLLSAEFEVAGIDTKPYKRSPAAPFITSTLQQEAGRKLRFSSQRTMSAAQRLYENGYITYMRTDSTTLADVAVAEARRVAEAMFGADHIPEKPRTYSKKVKNAQEAHEAIRPSGETWRSPDSIQNELGTDEFKVYELIWRRTIASQMRDAVGSTATVRIRSALVADAVSGSGEILPAGSTATFSTSGTQITFQGFLKAYAEDFDDSEQQAEESSARDGAGERLPLLVVGERVVANSVVPDRHDTQPPARFTEASLVKALEELGVGRPSTYAAIMQTIVDRGYCWRKGQALVPSYVAFAVVGLLERYFASLVDYSFTATLEDDLDQIAAGELIPSDYLTSFYFGEGGSGLKDLVSTQLADIDAREINTLEVGETPDGEMIVARVGKFGTYIRAGDATAPVPDDLAPDELTVSKALEILNTKKQDRVVGTDPDTGFEVVAKVGRFGPYVQLVEPNPTEKAKPKTSSLFADMTVETISIEDALQLLRLPRTVGTDPESGEEIIAQNGRFGPYLSRGKDSRSLPDERSLLSIDLEGALTLFAMPKQGPRARAAAAPVNVIGESPVTGKGVSVRAGRFGPYVTDGEVNASIPKGTDPDSLDLDGALELLRARREKLADQPSGALPKRTTSKKAPAKRRT